VDKPSENVEIDLTEPVSLTFSLKYLTNFCKASGLSDSVKLCLSSEVPLLVEYGVQNNSYLRFYLAPKVRSTVIRLHDVYSNQHRLAMKSSFDGRERYVFHIYAEYYRRIDFDMHAKRLDGSCSWFWCVGLAKDRRLQVSRALAAE
jgi:hypothetical protein